MKILLFSNWLPQKSTSSLFTFLTPLFLYKKKAFKIFWGNVCFTLCTSSYLATWPNSTLVLFLHILVFDPWQLAHTFHTNLGIWHLILEPLVPYSMVPWYFSFHGIWHLILGTLSNLPAIAFGATISSIFCSCALPLRI